MIRILKQDIINKIKRNSTNSNQEYKFVCDWYGKEFYGDTYSSILDDIINNYVVKRGQHGE
jgi:hypothetical protein